MVPGVYKTPPFTFPHSFRYHSFNSFDMFLSGSTIESTIWLFLNIQFKYGISHI